MFSGSSVTAEEKKPLNAVRVLEATYGGNCARVVKGNVTKFIALACDGTDLCNYHVYYKNMGGDPAAAAKRPFASPTSAVTIHDPALRNWHRTISAVSA